MRWVTDVEQARELLLQAGTCHVVDNRRVSTPLECTSFDDAGTCTAEFNTLIQSLMKLSGDEKCNYIVLDPDPIQYFLRHFNKYPILEICAGDSSEQYLALLNEDPGGSPADAVGTNCYEWVILPHSHKWFIHCVRISDDSGGHLWIPESWIAKALDVYQWLRYPAGLATNTDPSWS